MKKIAYLFPGQGAQYLGMGKDFVDAFSIAKETFQEADDLLGFHLSRIIFEGPQEALVETKNAQVAIFVTSVAILRVMKKQVQGISPFVCAGLSLGEYTALCAAGKLSFQETLSLVQKRAQLMQEACQKVPGTMAAVLGLEGEKVEEALQGLHGVWVANFNCPGQIVISGTKEGVAVGSEKLKAIGAKRVIPLTVSGAFHSGLMQIAQNGLAPFVEMAPIQDTAIELVMNVPGSFVKGVDTIRNNLINQVTQSVRWDQGIRAMDGQKIELYLEIGPGTTLSGMNRKIGVTGSTISLDKVADLEKLANQIDDKGSSCSSCC